MPSHNSRNIGDLCLYRHTRHHKESARQNIHNFRHYRIVLRHTSFHTHHSCYCQLARLYTDHHRRVGLQDTQPYKHQRHNSHRPDKQSYIHHNTVYWSVYRHNCRYNQSFQKDIHTCCCCRTYHQYTSCHMHHSGWYQRRVGHIHPNNLSVMLDKRLYSFRRYTLPRTYIGCHMRHNSHDLFVHRHTSHHTLFARWDRSIRTYQPHKSAQKSTSSHRCHSWRDLSAYPHKYCYTP